MNKAYDLEQRTLLFSENLIKLCKIVRRTNITDPIINQLIRSGTSIGANYCEANGASSKKDFSNKIYICKKETKETMYWLRLLTKADDKLSEKCKSLWEGTNELVKIFSKIVYSLNNPIKN